LAYRLYEWKETVVADPSAIAAKLKELADRGGVGLTTQRLVVDGSLAAVATATRPSKQRPTTAICGS
jgi:hypothetical protein